MRGISYGIWGFFVFGVVFCLVCGILRSKQGGKVSLDVNMGTHRQEGPYFAAQKMLIYMEVTEAGVYVTEKGNEAGF